MTFITAHRVEMIPIKKINDLAETVVAQKRSEMPRINQDVPRKHKASKMNLSPLIQAFYKI